MHSNKVSAEVQFREDDPYNAIGTPFFPQALLLQVPKLGATYEQKDQALALVKYTYPMMDWWDYWYVREFDGQDICYGLVLGYTVKWDYFSLSDLYIAAEYMTLGVDRDAAFKPKPFNEVIDQHLRDAEDRDWCI